MKIRRIKGNIYRKENIFDKIVDNRVGISCWILAIGLLIALVIEVGK